MSRELAVMLCVHRTYLRKITKSRVNTPLSYVKVSTRTKTPGRAGAGPGWTERQHRDLSPPDSSRACGIVPCD